MSDESPSVYDPVREDMRRPAWFEDFGRRCYGDGPIRQTEVMALWAYAKRLEAYVKDLEEHQGDPCDRSE